MQSLMEYAEYSIAMSRSLQPAWWLVDCVWNVMAHAQKPDFVFRRNGRVHLNRWGRQFSRLLAAGVCVSALVMLDTPCSEVVWRVLATHSIRQIPFTSPPVRHRVPSHFNWTLPHQRPLPITVSFPGTPYKHEQNQMLWNETFQCTVNHGVYAHIVITVRVVTQGHRQQWLLRT
jgi:hypothetical protein